MWQTAGGGSLWVHTPRKGARLFSLLPGVPGLVAASLQPLPPSPPGLFCVVFCLSEGCLSLELGPARIVQDDLTVRFLIISAKALFLR